MRVAAALAFAVILSVAANAQTTLEKINNIVDNARAQVGVAWIDESGTHTVNNAGAYPLMSVFKLHGAVAALRRMEKAGTPVDTVITVRAEQMTEGTYSPLLSLHRGEDFSIPFAELLRYSVAESDNNACDIIIGMAGGIEGLNAEMRAIGLTDFNISETEAAMHDCPSRAYNNHSTPLSVVTLLQKLYCGGILSGVYADCLKAVMLSTTTGQDKMKAAIAPDMRLAHKTGTGFTLPDGTITADNDAGVVIAADGRLTFIAVLIKDSAESRGRNASIIRDVTKAILYD